LIVSGALPRWFNTVTFQRLMAVTGLVSICACSWMGGPETVVIGPTLTEMQPARMPDTGISVPEISLDQLEASYRSALEVADDPLVRRQVSIRLAGLEMQRAESRQINATEAGQRFFDTTIGLYQALLEAPPIAGEDPAQRERLLYQLAKAYALDGRVEDSAAVLDRLADDHPQSPFMAEAQFRRAERAFSNGDYKAATRSYYSVMQQGEESAFFNNAVYMHGWSLFKRGGYKESLVSFTRVLDLMSAQLPEPERGNLQVITGPQKSLVQDTLHVMSLVFSYLDGAQTIDVTYKDLGQRPYVHLLYLGLGQLYLDKRRYRDSAETYQQYVKNHPLSDYAPDFSVRTIDVYSKGNFPSLLLPAKQDFVRNYGIYSDYWALKSESVQEQLRPHLHTFIDELAKYEHAQAQQLKQRLAGNKGKLKDKQQAATEARQKFLRAADWYREFSETFPGDPATPNRVFLMAEALYEAGELPRAYSAYRRAAYDFGDTKHGAEAGYSAILSAAEQLQTLAKQQQVQDGEVQEWHQRKIQSALQFADTYPRDKRAARVLAQAAQELLEQGQPVPAVAAATRVTQWQPAVEKNLRHTAWLVVGQGQFDTAHFVEAEAAYQQVLQLLSAEHPSRDKIVERIAASIYRRAEQLLAAEQKADAVQQLLRIPDLAPASEIAMTAHYDAANYLMDLQQWSQAQVQWLDFRERYDEHPLAQTLPAKLVAVYEQQQAWSAAAAELTAMSERHKDPEVRRQSLYLAAEYYEKGGDIATAILRYRHYAHTYAEPFDQVMEARFKMSELYRQTSEPQKRRFWLRKLVVGDKGAGAERTDRSRYLGAFASSELADDSYQAFARLPLKLPLKRSLQKKREALKKALSVYEAILEYEVAEFTTLANYRIGAIYSQLSRDLMNSERPGDLDALALEQYEILLEEQAFPFEEQAIEIHQNNARRSWSGIYDKWVKQSFSELEKLLPGRYHKQEISLKYSDGIY